MADVLLVAGLIGACVAVLLLAGSYAAHAYQRFKITDALGGAGILLLFAAMLAVLLSAVMAVVNQ